MRAGIWEMSVKFGLEMTHSDASRSAWFSSRAFSCSSRAISLSAHCFERSRRSGDQPSLSASASIWLYTAALSHVRADCCAPPPPIAATFFLT